MGRSVCGYFFGGYHDAAGVIMAVAREEVHSLVHGHNQPANLGELFADVPHLLFEAFDASSESAQFTYDPTHGERLADLKSYQGDQQQGDKCEKAVEDV